MLACFEHWFGPYPWYPDGYKLIEAPHLGMEHQSGVAYGNHFKNGYLGRDLSGTGWGLKWDFIIVHESAHEWWGNSISAKDHADMWIHESFANYAEGIYAECQDGKAAGAAYIIGSRRNIQNDEPIIPARGVNAEGSGDMYYKGGSMLHMIRQLVRDDEKWRGILRGLQSTFWHQTVTGEQIEDYISKESGIDLAPLFKQYLTTTMVPVLEYKVDQWRAVVPLGQRRSGLRDAGEGRDRRYDDVQLDLTDGAVEVAVRSRGAETAVRVDPNFYVEAKRADNQ